MRYVTIALLMALPLCAETVSVDIDTDDPAQAAALVLLQEAKAEALAEAAAVTLADVEAKVEADTTLDLSTDFRTIGGVTLDVSKADPQYVNVTLDSYDTATGFLAVILRGARKSAVDDFKGKADGGVIHMRRDRAVDFLKALAAEVSL